MKHEPPLAITKRNLMSSPRLLLAALASLVVFLASALVSGNGTFAEESMTRVDQGRELAFDRAVGNCLACHMMAGGDLAGNIGPPLLQMKARFPDPALLKKQIEDPESRNPETVMPPYGKHQILTDEEIDLIVEFLYTL